MVPVLFMIALGCQGAEGFKVHPLPSGVQERDLSPARPSGDQRKNHRKTVGKPWENHGKTIGKPWETIVTRGYEPS